MKIIAFGHRRRMGKDTAANFALRHMRLDSKLNCQRAGFADPLKAEAYRMFKWAGLEEGIYYENHPELKEKILPPIGKSPRQIWIEIGEAMRVISPKVWPEMMLSQCDCDILFVSDLRHASEVDYIRQTNGYAIKIIRPGIEKSTDPVDCSLSEYEEWDGTIINSGTLKQFNWAVKTFVLPKVMNDVRSWVVDCNSWGVE